MLAPILGSRSYYGRSRPRRKSKLADRVVVATDDESIFRTVLEAGFVAEMTSPAHQSGTDRVWEVVSRLDSKWIINLQGDEPLMKRGRAHSLAETALKGESDGHPLEYLATLICDLDPQEGRPRPESGQGCHRYFRRRALFFALADSISKGRCRAEILSRTFPAKYLLHFPCLFVSTRYS